MDEDAIVVFTARSPARIIDEKGSQAWKLNPARAKLCTWLICTQNRHNPDHEFSDATEPHGSAFLIGKVSGVIRSPEEGSEDRWKILISEYATLSQPNVWDHGHNPVRYSSLEKLGISLDGLEFHPVLPAEDRPAQHSPHPSGSSPAMLTIPEAKKALAATFGVKPEAVEITIRG